MTPGPHRLRRAVAAVATGWVLVGPIALATAVEPAAGSPAIAAQEAGDLELVSATSLVPANGTFTARIDLGSLASAADLSVTVTVYTVLDNERGLDAAPRRPINQLPTRPLSDLPVDAAGVLTVDVPIRGGEPFDDLDRIRIPDAGIYPVVVDLRDPQGVVASLRLDLIRLAATPAAPPATGAAPSRPLGLAVPVGQHGLSVADATDLLRRHRSVPLTVVLGPGVLSRLSSTDADADAEADARGLAAAVGTRPVVSVVEPDLDPSALAAIGQGDLYLEAVASTADAVARLGFVADRTIVATTTPLTADGADLVVRAGGKVAVELGSPTTPTADDTTQDGAPDGGTLATPSGPLAVVSLDSGGPTDERDGTAAAGGTGSAPAGDPGDRGGPVGVAHHELAHLMSRPPGGVPRVLGGFGPLDRARPDAFGDPAVLDVLLDVLSETGAARATPPADPSARPFTLLGLGDAAAQRAAGAGLVPAAAPGTDLGPVAESLTGVQDLLSTYDGFYADGRDSPAELRARVARALSVDRSAEERSDELAAVAKLLNNELLMISLPDDQKVTLAARRATIPLTITNDASGERNVLLTFRSANVTVTDNNKLITVDPRENAVYVEVEARALGESPLVVTVRTPDGRHVLDTTQFRVRSTAVPGLGLAISAAGLVGLGIWWYVSIKRNRANGGRRRRRWGGGPGPDDDDPDDDPEGGGSGSGATVLALPVDRSAAGELDRTASLVGDSVVP